MTILKKVADGVKAGLFTLLSPVFCVVSSVVIHASGLDKVDSWPTPEEIEKQNAWAEELKKKYPTEETV